jgi:hypothetical protein
LIYYPQEIGGFFESQTIGSFLFSYKEKEFYSGGGGVECDPTCCHHPGQILGKVVEFETHSTSREKDAVDRGRRAPLPVC